MGAAACQRLIRAPLGTVLPCQFARSPKIERSREARAPNRPFSSVSRRHNEEGARLRRGVLERPGSDTGIAGSDRRIPGLLRDSTARATPGERDILSERAKHGYPCSGGIAFQCCCRELLY